MIDYQNIEATILGSFEEGMRRTQQTPVWHAEGDVYAHTMMVVEALHGLPEYTQLGERQQYIMTIAALLHDIGKIPTTTWEENEWKAPHHAPTGSRMARKVLWKEYGLCGSLESMQVREAICLLIRYHSFPPHANDMENGVLRLHRLAANNLLVPDFSIRMLCMLSKADMLGRWCEDQQLQLEKIALCEEMAKKEKCYDSCYPFASDVVRQIYLSGQNPRKELELNDDTWGEVVLISGLPCPEKDTWISKTLPDMPIISLDNIWCEQKVLSKKEQSRLVNIAREQAKEYLQKHQPFVWNATNITSQIRKSLIELFETYQARVRIVYLETDWQTMHERNHQQEVVVPLDVKDKMLDQLVLPEVCEARNVEWIGRRYIQWLSNRCL